MKKQTFEHGDMVVIIERKVSDKVQPNIRRGDLYVVDDVGQTKSGAIALVCLDNKKGKHRINSDRFEFKAVTEKELKTAKRVVIDEYTRKLEEAKEKEFKQMCRDTTKQIAENFSREDHIRISLAPLIVAHMAFLYADMCREWCASNKISETKTISRELMDVYKQYQSYLLLDLDMKHFENISNQAREFINSDGLRNTLMVSKYAIGNEFLKQHPNVTQLERREYAYISKLMIEAYMRHNAKMSSMIRRKVKNCIGEDKDADNPFVTIKLANCLDKYLGEFKLQKSNEINRISKIIDNAIINSDFKIPT